MAKLDKGAMAKLSTKSSAAMPPPTNAATTQPPPVRNPQSLNPSIPAFKDSQPCT